MSEPTKNPAAVALGRLGGSKSTPAKTAANKINASKPRPNARKKKIDPPGQV